MLRILRSRLFIIFVFTLFILMGYLLFVKNNTMGKVTESKITVINLSNQKKITEFDNKSRNYSYVSFDNLYENTALYFGSKIYQFGHIKKINTRDQTMLVTLDGNDPSKTCKIRYGSSDFARGISDLQEDDAIEFYGKVLSIDDYMNEKGREMSRPVISANFIQMKLKNRGK
ncbi:hypothetical protein [Companilactobacillus alimentarius]|uniref:hypothetical protein n=1 Tax=Companilactobacillus alimentarius TaxID=1602 RepID=UPI0028B63522|nr:hypothetical protein [Companilactobacillus alimentarius]MDT6951660.1 hypothetical protein [Companilactobacillus alimentarius]